MTRINPIE